MQNQERRNTINKMIDYMVECFHAIAHSSEIFFYSHWISWAGNLCCCMRGWDALPDISSMHLSVRAKRATKLHAAVNRGQASHPRMQQHIVCPINSVWIKKYLKRKTWAIAWKSIWPYTLFYTTAKFKHALWNKDFRLWSNIYINLKKKLIVR